MVLSTSLRGVLAATDSIVDDLGRTVKLPHSIRRIVSLAPSVTEILYAVGAKDKIVGDTAYCDYPSDARKLPHVGDTVNPNAEQIISMRPDMVIMSSNLISSKEADQMAARWHTSVFITNPESYADVERNIGTLGQLLGNPKETRVTLKKMEAARLQVVRATTGKTRPTVFAIVWDDPLMTASGRSFIGDLIRLAGGTNIAETMSGDYPTCSPEIVVQHNPDYILTSNQGSQVTQTNLTYPWRKALVASKSRHIYAVPTDWTYRPGPRLGLGLLAIAKILHPHAPSQPPAQSIKLGHH